MRALQFDDEAPLETTGRSGFLTLMDLAGTFVLRLQTDIINDLWKSGRLVLAFGLPGFVPSWEATVEVGPVCHLITVQQSTKEVIKQF